MGKKQTTSEWLNDDIPELAETQQFARVLGPRGNSQHEVEYTDGSQKLVVLPPKFRNLVWVKRGHYVVVDASTGTTSEKVGGEISYVLSPKHIKKLKEARRWPSEFSDRRSDDEEEEEDDLLFVNRNRHVMSESEESSSEEEDDDEEK